MGGIPEDIVGGDPEYGGTVLWEAARIEWALLPVVAALIVIALAFIPSGESPLASAGGGSFSSETPLDASVSCATTHGAGASPLESE